MQKSRAAVQPRLGVLGADTPLGVFSNHLYLLQTSAVQLKIGAVVRYLKDEAPPMTRQQKPPAGAKQLDADEAELGKLAEQAVKEGTSGAITRFQGCIRAIEVAVIAKR